MNPQNIPFSEVAKYAKKVTIKGSNNLWKVMKGIIYHWMYLKGKAVSMINSTYTVQTASGGFPVYLLSKTGKLGKCNCSSCPVHMMNECVEEKRMKAMEMMPKIKETKMMPEPEMVPGMYCANGKATCTDIYKTDVPM